MREKPTPERVDEVLQRAECLERVDPESLSAVERKGPIQFGKNFYLLFEARRIIKARTNRDESPAEIFPNYLDEAEALGEPWKRFVAENAQLLAEIDRALSEKSVYDDVLSVLRDFYSSGDHEDADEYDKMVHPELGINAIGIPIWRRLNELLQQAADAMDKVGIDPTPFYE